MELTIRFTAGEWPEGSVQVEGLEECIAFSGWLDLLRVLETYLPSTEKTTDLAPPPRPPPRQSGRAEAEEETSIHLAGGRPHGSLHTTADP